MSLCSAEYVLPELVGPVWMTILRRMPRACGYLSAQTANGETAGDKRCLGLVCDHETRGRAEQLTTRAAWSCWTERPDADRSCAASPRRWSPGSAGTAGPAGSLPRGEPK